MEPFGEQFSVKINEKLIPYMHPPACLPICVNSVDDGVEGPGFGDEGVCGVGCRVNNLQIAFPHLFLFFSLSSSLDNAC